MLRVSLKYAFNSYIRNSIIRQVLVCSKDVKVISQYFFQFFGLDIIILSFLFTICIQLYAETPSFYVIAVYKFVRFLVAENSNLSCKNIYVFMYVTLLNNMPILSSGVLSIEFGGDFHIINSYRFLCSWYTSSYMPRYLKPRGKHGGKNFIVLLYHFSVLDNFSTAGYDVQDA